MAFSRYFGALKKAVIAGALLLVALLLVLWLDARQQDLGPVSGPVARIAEAPAPTERPAIAAASPAATAPPRVVLPRPTPAAPPGAGAAIAETDGGSAARPIKIAELAGKLKDRRGADAPPDADFELELIHAGLDTVQEDIEECLAQWNDTGGLLDGEVLIGFQLDESGLTESWVQDDAELPFGVKSCFGNAVYGVDWSHVVKKPAEVTQKFAVSKAPR